MSGQKVPKGYKQTEVGVIPEDWNFGALDKFWSVADCKHVTAKFIESGIPVASIREVQSRFVNLDHANQTTEIYYRRLIEGGRKPQSGDLILSRNATVGEIAQVADCHPQFAMGQDVCLLRKRSDKFSTSLLQQIFQSWIVLRQLENCMVGSTFRRVNVAQIKNLRIPFPPIGEQKLIARALSDIDALIEGLEGTIGKKRHIKQGAMQELLRSKDDWETMNLGSLGIFSKGSGVKKDESDSGSLPCVRYGEIYTKHNDFIKQFYSWISRDVADTSTRLRTGDLLFTGSGETREEIGKCVAFIDEIEAYAGGDITILRPTNSNSQFMGYYLNTRPIVRQKASKGQGDAVVHIGASALSSIQVTIPTLGHLEQLPKKGLIMRSSETTTPYIRC
jgi:type I restriction enzyme, S subunit